MVLLAAHGGLRFGELTALTRADLTIPDDGLPIVTMRRAMHRINGSPQTCGACLRYSTASRIVGLLLIGGLGLYSVWAFVNWSASGG